MLQVAKAWQLCLSNASGFLLSDYLEVTSLLLLHDASAACWIVWSLGVWIVLCHLGPSLHLAFCLSKFAVSTVCSIFSKQGCKLLCSFSASLACQASQISQTWIFTSSSTRKDEVTVPSLKLTTTLRSIRPALKKL